MKTKEIIIKVQAVLRNSGRKSAENFVGLCNIISRRSASGMPLLLQSRHHVICHFGTVRTQPKKLQ
jgi:hypothetical protein